MGRNIMFAYFVINALCVKANRQNDEKILFLRCKTISLMKFRIYILLCIIMLLLIGNDTYAGFAVRKQTTVADSSAIVVPGINVALNNEETTIYNSLKTLKLPHGDGDHHHHRGGGWAGIVALCCGILCFPVASIWLAILAIVFGAIGMGRWKTNRGMAIAGLILGILGLVIIGLALVLFFTLFSWW